MGPQIASIAIRYLYDLEEGVLTSTYVHMYMSIRHDINTKVFWVSDLGPMQNVGNSLEKMWWSCSYAMWPRTE